MTSKKSDYSAAVEKRAIPSREGNRDTTLMSALFNGK
jgi:hypothetical protein